MNKQIHITKRNIWRSVIGVLITAAMSFAGIACATDDGIDANQPAGELKTATFEFSFSAGTPANRTRAGELAWDDTAVECVWVGIFIDDESYGEENGKLIGAELWDMSNSGIESGSHGTGYSEKVGVSVMYNDAKPPKVKAAGIANFKGIKGYSSPTAEAEDIETLLAGVKTWDDYMAIAVDAESADAAEYRIMSNLVTFGSNGHFNYTADTNGTVTSSGNGQYIFDKLDGYSKERITGWLHLRRLISHSTVNIYTGENVEVTNLRYQVFNVPTRTYVQERTMTVLENNQWEALTSWEELLEKSPNAADYFGSDTYPGNEAPYYTSLEADDIEGSSFEFSHYDNKHWGLKGGSCEAYTDREKVFDGSELYSSLCTSADKWYNNYASYFRIYATVTVTDETKGKVVTADVVYTIHDGFCNNADLSEYTGTEEGRKARDFMSVRNTDYTYKVTIYGIDNIIVSVMSGEAGNAGASGALIEYVYEANPDGKYGKDEDETDSVELKLTDAQRSSLKWRIYTPASDAFVLADFGTFDDVDDMAAKYPSNWRIADNYSIDIDENDAFYNAVIFYSGDTEIGTVGDFTKVTSSDNTSLTTYTVKINEKYAAAAKTSSESESLARILYLYVDESYSAGGSEYKPLFVFKQYPQDGRGTLSTPEIESIEFTNSITASPSAAIATYVESMTATWSESSFDGVSADVYEVYIDEILIGTVENGALTYTTEYVSTMTSGTYTLGVVAKVTDDTLKPSEMAVKEFEIYPTTMLWDFSTKKWQTVLEAVAPGAKGNNISDWTVSLDGLTYTSGSGNGKWDTTYIQPNGAGDASKRVFSFTAYGPGILKVVASNTSGSADMNRNVTVQLGNDAANAMSKPGGYAAGSQQPIEFYLNITETTTVSIYPTGGLRFYSMEFTYVEQEPIEPSVWDFSSTEWQAEFAKYGTSNTDIENWNLTFDGLNIYSTAKSKYNTTFFQWGGKGSTSDRYLKFEALTSGKLTVTASNTGSSEDLSRMVTVNQGGTETSKAGGTASNADPSVLTFDVDAGEVYIYCTGNALRFYKVEFDGGVKK